MTKQVSALKLVRWADRICEFSFLGAVFFLPFSKAILEILLFISSTAWIMSKIINNDSFSKDRTIFIIFGFFVITSSISAFNSGYPILAVRGILKLLRYGLSMLVAADLFRDSYKLKKLLMTGLASLSLVLIDTLFQNISGKDLFFNLPVRYANQEIRLTGPYKSYGLLGAHLICALPILFSFILSIPKKNNQAVLKKIAWICLLLVGLYTLYKTNSRGAWLAALASWVLYAFMIRNKWLIIFFLGTIITMPFILPKSVLFHLDAFNQEQSLVERSLLWSRAMRVIESNPIFGCGINTYIRNYQKYGDKGISKHEIIYQNYAHVAEKETWRVPGHPSHIPDYYVHNGYLQLAAETGLLSLVLFLLLLGKGIWSGFLAFRNSEGKKKFLIGGLFCGFIALLFQATVDTTLHNLQSAVLIWLFLGLLFAVGAVTNTNKHEK